MACLLFVNNHGSSYCQEIVKMPQPSIAISQDSKIGCAVWIGGMALLPLLCQSQ